MSTFYTYFHTRNDSGAIFYVGKGKEKRAYDCVHRSANWKNIVTEHGHTVTIADRFDDEKDALAHERYLIASLRAIGSALCNITSGGQGTSGWVPSDEARAKMSAVKQGCILSEAHRNNIAKSHLVRQSKEQTTWQLIEKCSDPMTGFTTDLKQIQKRLLAFGNMALLGRVYRIPYRTLQRFRAGTKNANMTTVAAINLALDGAGA